VISLMLAAMMMLFRWAQLRFFRAQTATIGEDQIALPGSSAYHSTQ